MIKELTLSGLLLLAGMTQTNAQSAGAPAPDAKFAPNLMSNSNTSIGSIYSPSLFDGSANISIPIFSFGNDFGNFGVSLGYNTKGVKVDVNSGPIGTNWNLNAGGSIRRIVKDYPDELLTNAGYKFNGVSQSKQIKGRFHYYLDNPADPNTFYDKENDDFILSVGSLNVTFQIGKDGYVFTHPHRDIKVEFYRESNGLTYPITDNSALIQYLDDGFRITDEDGTKYYFVPDYESKTSLWTGEAPPVQGLPFTGQWLIRKIEFVNGQKIEYDYEEQLVPESYHIGWSVVFEEKNDNTTNEMSSYIDAAEEQQNYHIIKEIRYPNNVKVLFNYDQTPQEIDLIAGCLKSIKNIEVHSEDQCVKYRLYKSYRRTDPASGNFTTWVFDNSCRLNNTHLEGGFRRIMLDSVKILNCDESKTEPYYAFEYIEGPFSVGMSSGVDYFGYANSVPPPHNDRTVPEHLHPFSGATMGRSNAMTDSVDIMSRGNLKTVKNAYGKSVTFEYELHSGLTNVIDNLPTDPLFLGKDVPDGLRVKSITHADKYRPADQYKIRYFYSGGQFFLNGGYFSYPSNRNSSTHAITEYTMTASWISAHQLINGSNHGYSTVTVEERGQQNNLLGRTEYQFSNFKDGNNLRYFLNGPSGKHYYEQPYTDKQYIKDWEIGLVNKVTNYDRNDKVVSIVNNTYNSVIDYTSSVAGLELNNKELRMPKLSNGNIYIAPVIASDLYAPYSGHSQLVKTETETFMNDYVSTKDEVTYTYDERNRRTTVKTTNSVGESHWINSIYNYKVCGSGLAACAPAISALNNSGIELEVSMERWKKSNPANIYNTDDKLTDATVKVYDMIDNKLLLKSLYVRKPGTHPTFSTYTGVGTVPIPNGANLFSTINHIYNTGTATNDYFPKVSEVTQFDAKGNPLEVQLYPGTDYKSMIWDTLLGAKNAEVMNARYADIGYTSFENTVYGTSYTGNENITNGRFSYKHWGVSMQETPVSGRAFYKLAVAGPNSVITSPALTAGKTYVLTFWSKNGAPQLAGAGLSSIPLELMYTTGGWSCYKAQFTPSANGTVAFTAPTLTLFIDELRLFPLGATMVNYIHMPLFGVISQTDPTGRVSKFEYDDFGRPVLTRDQEGNITSKTEYHIGQ